MAAGCRKHVLGRIANILRDQADLIRLLMSDARFRVPMIALWFADAGGSLHMPMVMFFFLRLGAGPWDLGVFGFVMRGGSMLFSPLYGHCVDKYGLRPPLLVCMALCGMGCIVRGLAQTIWHLYIAQFLMGAGGGSSWTMVKGYVAKHTDEDKRSLVVNGLRAQMLAISLMKVLYPALNSTLAFVFALETQLARYRAVITTCTFFCWGGVGLLVFCPPLPAAAHKEATAGARLPADGGRRRQEESEAWKSFLPQTLAVAFSSCATTVCTSLWPLFLKSRFGWEATQYAYLSFADSALTASALSAGAGKTSGLRAGRWLAALAAAALLLAYCPGSVHFASTGGGQMMGHSTGNGGLGPHVADALPPFLVAWHAPLALVAAASIEMLTSCLETSASLTAAQNQQGVVMGVLATAKSIGALCGSLVGMWLWGISTRPLADATSASEPFPWPIAEGRLPYLLTAVLLSCIWLLLRLLEFRGAKGTLVGLGHAKVGDQDEEEEDEEESQRRDSAQQKDDREKVVRAVADLPSPQRLGASLDHGKPGDSPANGEEDSLMRGVSTNA